MAKKICKLPYLKNFVVFLLTVLFTLSACAKNGKESSNYAADSATSNTSAVHSEQPADTMYNKLSPSAPITDEVAGLFSENPQALELYRAVLQEEATFYSTYDQEYMTLKQFTQFHNGGQLKAEISEFALVDLDSDGQLEIILPLTKGIDDIFVYEVLHCQNDIVYGYSLPYRSFRDLKTDGTFYGSSGAGWKSWGTIQFGEDTYTIIEYANTETYYDSHGSKVLYFVEGENVSERVYYSRISEWRNGEEVNWYTFSDETLSQIS